jgi:hypothetical protein
VFQRGVEIVVPGNAAPFLRHHEFHQIAEISRKALRQFGGRPRATRAANFLLRVQISDTPRSRGELAKSHEGKIELGPAIQPTAF